MTSEIKNFNFSFEVAARQREELESQVSSLKERIEKIVNHFTIDDAPILKFILNMSPSREELKKLSKAIDRLADLADLHDKYNSKLSVISMAQSDPNWFVAAFGDFDTDVDDCIKNILPEG